MGQEYTKEIRDPGERDFNDQTHPSDADWITKHASWTGLSVVEVERLWLRFKQLGCNKDGILTKKGLQHPDIKDNAFIRNTFKKFKSPDDSVEFHVFLNLMKWIEDGQRETKIRAIFRLLNNGDNISKQILGRILANTFPEDSQDYVSECTELLLRKMDDDDMGEIDEEQWVYWVSQLPRTTLAQLLEFSIIPSDIASAVEQDTPRTLSQLTTRSIHESEAGEGPSHYPTDDILKHLSERISRQDWMTVVNKLGYLQSDLKPYKKKYKNTLEMVHHILLDWRGKAGPDAKTDYLQDVLRQCNMDEVADEL